MRYMLKIAAVCLAGVAAAGSPVASTLAGPPTSGPGTAQSQADWGGVVEFVGDGGGKIVVDDREYAVSPGTVIHGTRGGRSAIQKGMKVDIKSQPGAQGGRFASEIWIR